MFVVRFLEGRAGGVHEMQAAATVKTASSTEKMVKQVSTGKRKYIIIGSISIEYDE